MKVLSKNNAELKTIFPIILSLFGSVIAFAFIKQPIVLKCLVSFGVLIMGAIWTYRKYIQSYNLFYSKENLILKNMKRERNISLTNIKRVKLTLSDMRIMGSQFYLYKIDFTNETGLFETISFYVSNMNSLLWEFQDLIKSKSQNTIIENHVSSWEK